MESEAIATSTVSLLAPHFCKADKTIADKTIIDRIGAEAGEKMSNMVETLYEIIKNKFNGDDYANKTLRRLKEMPEDEGRQSAMKSILKEALAKDPQFQEMLHQFLAEMKQVGGDDIIQIYGNGAHADHGGVAGGAGSIVVGRDIYGHNITFYGYTKGQSKGTDRFYVFFSCEHIPTCERFKIFSSQELKPRCCFKNEIETNKEENWEIIFKGRIDFHNSIYEAYKAMQRYYNNCIFIINPYQEPNHITYFQLGYALGKEMEILGVFDKDGCRLKQEIEEIKFLPNVDVVSNMDEFSEKLGEKLKKIKPIKSVSSKNNNTRE